MSAIEDLNATLIKYSVGMADAKGALQEKGISVTNLTISNLGEKIRSIVVPVTYTFAASDYSAIWGSSDIDIKIITITSTDSTGASSAWTYTRSGDYTYFSINVNTTTGKIEMYPLFLDTTVIRNAYLNLTQTASGKTLSIQIKQTVGEIPIEI